MKTGIYRHYKGGLYDVLHIAFDTENLEQKVVYKMLYDSEKFPAGTIWVRDKKMFEEKVSVNGKEVLRFEYMGNKKYDEI